jgi:hypothetical protein
MQIVTAFTNGAYPNRVQLVVSPPFVGPFTQPGPLGAFNPVRDLSIYADGALQTISSFSFDTNNSRYLIYLIQAIDPQSFVQVVHHVPNPPFMDLVAGSIPDSFVLLEDGSILLLEDGGVVELESSVSELPNVPGFALVATFIPAGDIVSPEMALTPVPSTAIFAGGTITPNVIDLLWLTAGVAQVIITGTNGLDTGFLGPSGVYFLDLTGSGSGWGVSWGNFWGGGTQGPGTIILTMTGYDAVGNPILVGSPPILLTVTATITITT